MASRIKHTQEPRIDAGLINRLIRDAYDRGDEEEALVVGRQCVQNVTDAKILMIAHERADLVGVSPGPISYVVRPR